MIQSKLAPIALSVILAASLAACAKPEAAKLTVDTAKITDTVKTNAQAMVAALNARDAEKAVAYDAPQTVGMFHGAPNVNNAAQDLATTKQQVADPAFHLTVADETVDVAQAGDMALYKATYAYTGTDPKTKKPMTETGNWVIQYKVQGDGSWKVATSVVSDTGPAPAAAAPEKK